MTKEELEKMRELIMRYYNSSFNGNFAGMVSIQSFLDSVDESIKNIIKGSEEQND